MRPANDVSILDFTQREIEIILFCKQNFSCKEIAEKFNISEKTVRKHRQNILSKFGGQGKADFRRFIREYDI
jgi:DNA-binding CsgD family transcriptional regulator